MQLSSPMLHEQDEKHIQTLHERYTGDTFNDARSIFLVLMSSCKYICPWSTEAVAGIFVAIDNNTLYGSKL